MTKAKFRGALAYDYIIPLPENRPVFYNLTVGHWLVGVLGGKPRYINLFIMTILKRLFI